MSEIKNIELLEHFIKYPGLYIGKPSIYGLQCFLAGCKVSGNNFGIDWKEFENWVVKKTGFKLSSISYGAAKYIAECDEAAFDTWIAWLQEFRKEKERESAPKSS